MGLEASCSWPPTHMLATSSSVLSNEGRRAAESLCAPRVSRGYVQAPMARMPPCRCPMHTLSFASL